MDEKERTPQEMEFILDGITTRMQMAMDNITQSSKNGLEKMSESVKMMHNAVRWLCITLLLVVIIVAAGFAVETNLLIGHANRLNESAAVSEVTHNEALPQFRPGAGD